MPCVYAQLRSRLWDLSTPAFRWTGHVKKGCAGVLYVLEAHGPMGLRELADRMGWGNYRELKRRYLEDREREDGSVLQGLISMGLVEDRGGVYALYGDHAERVEGVRCAPYTTVSRRRRETHDGDRVVRWVEETENTASEVEREEKDLQDHQKQRERFRLYLVRKSPEADEECRKLLNALDDEREFSVGEVEPDGEISELERVAPPDPDGTIRSEAEVFDLAKAFFANEEAA